MSDIATPADISTAIQAVDQAVQQKHLQAGARENIVKWLRESAFARYQPSLLQHIEEQRWPQLNDVFWTTIPFGTGGRRGRMYPIGTNAINDRTIGESAAGLAQYVRQSLSGTVHLSCAIAYDTRHFSRHFAELCSRIMVAAGFRVHFLDDYRSTPELSFLVRYKRCSCGIMVTASHNPPSDNAVKVYWSTGGQVLPPHDAGIIDQVMHHVSDIDEGETFETAIQWGQVEICTAEVHQAFIDAVTSQRFDGPRDLKILYSPLHGVGASTVVPVLNADGFGNVEVFADHAELNGDFPNVPDHVSNPENTAVFTSIVKYARQSGAELVMVSDPDCDRLGCATPLTWDTGATWQTLNGNQIGVLLTDYVLEQRRSTLTEQNYLVKTLVTTEMVRRIGESYGVRTQGNLLVGFKWIGGEMDNSGPDGFLLGIEESHGYLSGQYARDKDGAVAAMLLAEATACWKAAGQTLHEKLDSLYWQHGFHGERLVTFKMEGSSGTAALQELMRRFREEPPREMAELQVVAIRDYLNGRTISPDGSAVLLEAPRGDMVIFDLADEGNYVAARPSGTEPKIKFYLYTFVPAEQIADLETTKSDMARRLDALYGSLVEFCGVK